MAKPIMPSHKKMAMAGVAASPMGPAPAPFKKGGKVKKKAKGKK